VNLLGAGEAVLHEICLEPALGKFGSTEGSGKEAPLIMDRFDLYEPGTLQGCFLKTHAGTPYICPKPSPVSAERCSSRPPAKMGFS
jgi:hypothetical protein